METKKYFQGHLDRIEDGYLPLPDVNEAEIFVFLAITTQMGHCMQDKLTYYWATTVCPTRYRTRHFFNNSNTNEDITTKFEQKYVRCVRNEEECVCSALQMSLQYPH